MYFLLFQVYAPLVAWGDIAVGGERKIFNHPSKSAVIGLIAAAMGIKRNDEKLLNSLTSSLGMAVQVYSGGTLLKDFHTVQVPSETGNIVYHTRKEELSAPQKKIGTILSRREYLCDAFSVVAVYMKGEDVTYHLEDFMHALREPRYQLYFGRKSCIPAIPLNPRMIEGDDLIDVFDKYKVGVPLPINEDSSSARHKVFTKYYHTTILGGKSFTYYWEDGVSVRLQPLQEVEQYDLPQSRTRWQFSLRREYMAIEKRSEVV